MPQPWCNPWEQSLIRLRRIVEEELLFCHFLSEVPGMGAGREKDLTEKQVTSAHFLGTGPGPITAALRGPVGREQSSSQQQLEG